MTKQSLFLRISLGLLFLGLTGISTFSMIDWLRPKTGAEAELAQTKKMLRQGFDKNRALVKENDQLNEKYVQLLQQADEGKKQEESLRKQLETQLSALRKVTKERDATDRILVQIYRRHQALLARSRPQIQQLTRQAKEEKERADYLEDQRELDLLRTGGERMRGAVEELKARVKEKNEKIAELEKEKKSIVHSPQSIEKNEKAEVSSMDYGLSTMDSNEHAIRREIAQEYLGTIEDLLERIDQLKGEKGERTSPSPFPLPAGERIGEGNETIRELKETLEKERTARRKDRVTFYYNLGVAYTTYGLLNEAASIYEKALTIDPDDSSTHLNLGILLDEHLGKKDEAVKHYQRFIELEPENKRRREVEHWIRLAKSLGEGERGGRARSAKGAIENMFLTSTS